MLNSITFQEHLTSIMDILSKTAVAEILKLLDESYAVLRLEMSRNQIENKTLKRKLKLMEAELSKRTKQWNNCTERCVELQSSAQVLQEEGKDKVENQASEEITLCDETGDVGVWGDAETGSQLLEVDELQSAFPAEAEMYWREEMQESALISEKIQQDPCVTRVLTAAPSVHGQGVSSRQQLPSALNDTMSLKSCKHQLLEEPSDTASQVPYKHHTLERLSNPVNCHTAEGSSDTESLSPYRHNPEEKLSGVQSLGFYDNRNAERYSTTGDSSIGQSIPGITEEKPEADMLTSVMVKEEVEVHSPCSEDTGLQGLHTTPEQRGAGLFGVKREDWGLQQNQALHQQAGVEVMEDPSTEEEYGSSSLCTVNRTLQRTDTGEKLYSCSHCGKRFSQKSNVYKHLRIHTGEKPYRCIHCGKHFTHQSNMYEHLRIHTGEKPYSCVICGKCFTQQSSLKRHQRVHTGERPFSCAQCEKSFTRLSYLKMHQQVHTKENPECRVKYGSG